MLQALDDFNQIDDEETGYGDFDDPQEAQDPQEGFSNLVDDANAILLEESWGNMETIEIYIEQNDSKWCKMMQNAHGKNAVRCSEMQWETLTQGHACSYRCM